MGFVDTRVSARKRYTPVLLKVLLLAFIAVLAVLGLRLFPAVAAQGWLPVGSLVFGLLLIAGALVEAVRHR